MYKLCIDEEQEKLKPKFLTYSCTNCNYQTEIPIELIEIVSKVNNLNYQNDDFKPSFICPKCNHELKYK